MAISSEEKYLLNKMNRIAQKCQLGTLIENAESVVAGEIAIADGKVLIGGATGVAAAQTLSGDISISNSGVAAIGSGVIVNADVKSDAAIDYSKLAALSSANILVGSGANVATSVAVSGDVTITNAGVTAIGADKVTKAMLAPAVEMDFKVIAMGDFTTVGGDADESITSANVLVGDVVQVFIKKNGAGPVTFVSAVAAAGSISVVLSGDPSNDHILGYIVIRAVA